MTSVKGVGDLRLAIGCLLAAMALVLAGTFAQVDQGVLAAQRDYFRTWFVFYKGVPVFPGGYLLALLLSFNLLANFTFRLKGIGLRLVHFGLLLLFVGEAFTALFAIEGQMPLSVGESSNFTLDEEKKELVVIDCSHPNYDQVVSIPESLFHREQLVPTTPFTLKISGEKLFLYDDQLILEASLHQPKRFQHKGRFYETVYRHKRNYLPFTIKLTKFTHEKHPGTSIPANFASEVRIYDGDGNFDRTAKIYMNHPLRYQGKTFYQASYGENDTLSIFQVVENPSAFLPYLSSFFVALGLLVHFFSRLPKKRAALSLLLLLLPTLSFAEMDFYKAGMLPVQHQGRVKPFDTVARHSLLLLSGKQSLPEKSATEWLLELTIRDASSEKVFRIDHPDLTSLLESEEKLFSYQELSPHLEMIKKQAHRSLQTEEKERDLYQSAVLQLWRKIDLYLRLANTLFVQGAEDPIGEILLYEAGADALDEKIRLGDAISQMDLQRMRWFQRRYQTLDKMAEFSLIHGEKWLSTGEALLARYPETLFVAELIQAYRDRDELAFEQAISNFSNKTFTLSLEWWFNKLQPFFIAAILYAIATLFPYSSLLYAIFVLHTVGLFARMVIEGRPPVTNLYSSAIFVGWGTLFFALVVNWYRSHKLIRRAAALIGSLTLIVAHHLATSGDTMEMMRAVLNSNFWLATHVVIITLGYSSAFLAGILAAFALLLDRSSIKEMAKIVYGIISLSLFLSFVGTVLGGIWADQSWGRFWGWDPKENGALLVVLWNSIILHCRWGGFLSPTSLLQMAVGGNIVTSFSWFGVNLLGVGLHSYGFMEGSAFWLLLFIFSQLAIVLLAKRRSIFEVLKNQ